MEQESTESPIGAELAPEEFNAVLQFVRFIQTRKYGEFSATVHTSSPSYGGKERSIIIKITKNYKTKLNMIDNS